MSPSSDRASGRGGWAAHVVLIAASALAVGPLALGVLAAFKTPAQLASSSPFALPGPWSLSAFQEVLEGRSDLGRAFAITTATVLILLCVQLPLSFAAACALMIEPRLPLRRVLLAAVVGAFLVPTTVLVIPLYLLMSGGGLAETFPGLVAPFLLGSPWAVLLFRQSLRSIPRELLDAARIDGLGSLGLVGRILAPLSRGPILAVALVTVVTQWNAFLWPLVVSGTNWPVLTVATATLQNQQGTNTTEVLAGSALSILPIVALLLIFHRSFGRILTSRSAL